MSTRNPKFNLTGPDSIPQGVAASFRVDMYLPYPAVELNFDVFAPFNFSDSVTVCHVLVVGVGKNYECLSYLNLPLKLYPSESGLTTERATLSMGMVVNKGRWLWVLVKTCTMPLLNRMSFHAFEQHRQHQTSSTLSGSRLPNVPDEENRISVEFVVVPKVVPELVNQQLWLGATLEIGANEIWAIQQAFTALSPVPLTSVRLLLAWWSA